MQTPQIIRFDIYKKAYEFAKKTGFEGTDDISLIENYLNSCKRLAISDKHLEIKLVSASRQNFKITTKEDLEMAQNIFSGKRLVVSDEHEKIGIGEDAHWFENSPSLSREWGQGGELTLGGIKFVNYPKLKANSDGDVMIHAFCNALSSVLGGKSLGSFADKMYLEKGIIDSKEFLKPLLIDLKKRNLEIQSVSFSFECLVPKIDEISDDLKLSMSKILKIPKDKIGITATTGNKTSVFGKGKGVRCGCVVLVFHK
jgi:2-C-methyl-D-erythritol 2,4-cyclodiphosphate synthase